MKNVTRKQTRTQYVPAQNAFVQAMTNVSNVALTEKGAVTNKSTLSSVLDWFGQGGALRQRAPPRNRQPVHSCLCRGPPVGDEDSLLFP